MDMKVICLEEQAFFQLIEQVVSRLNDGRDEKYKWISDTDAMQLLGIKSKTTLQDYRNRGKIRYSQHAHKVILYDRESILAFLEMNAKETF